MIIWCSYCGLVLCFYVAIITDYLFSKFWVDWVLQQICVLSLALQNKIGFMRVFISNNIWKILKIKFDMKIPVCWRILVTMKGLQSNIKNNVISINDFVDFLNFFDNGFNPFFIRNNIRTVLLIQFKDHSIINKVLVRIFHVQNDFYVIYN